MSSDKEILRAEALRRRAAYRPELNDGQNAAIRFFKDINPDPYAIIAGYWPKENEFDIRPLLEMALAKNHICGLPVVQKESRALTFAKWKQTMTLEKGAYGILEPAIKEWLEPDIIIVPLLAFDRRGHRLGYGGGYYDATLTFLRAKKTTLVVGVGYDAQENALDIPNNEHDQKLDWILTPTMAKEF